MEQRDEAHLNECDVVVEGHGVVLGVDDDPPHVQDLPVPAPLRLAMLAHDHTVDVRVLTARQKRPLDGDVFVGIPLGQES